MATPEDIPGITNAFATVAEQYVHSLDRAVADDVSAMEMRELHELLALLRAAAARLQQ